MTDDAVEDERDIELESISAIFPEITINPNNSHIASLEIEVSPSVPLIVIFSPLSAATTGNKQVNILPTPPHSDGVYDGHCLLQARPVLNATPETHAFSFLPPLRLDITLPDGYPDEVPPRFHLSTCPDWLPPSILESLNDGANNLWEEYGRSQVVYAYIDFIQQEVERGFGLADRAGWELPHTLKTPLIVHDRQTKRKKFEQETFDCGVCLEPKKGSACYRLPRCGHVFCVACLTDFYNSAISEGDIANVKCLAPDCGKENMTLEEKRRKKQRALHPSELLEIPLERSQVQRYVNLKLKKKLESDKTTIYCPRSWCQGPARSAKYAKYDTRNLADFPESDSEDESSNGPALPVPNTNVATTAASTNRLPPPDRISICSTCNFAFCRLCQRSWHGEHINCLPRSTAELTVEEQASYDYIRLHTSPCPTCQSPCQKTHGCNHMRCFQCGSHFCYLCSSWLHPSDPYLHYNQKGKECYMLLWELEEGDEGPRPEGEGNAHFIGARAAEVAAAHLAAAEAIQAEDFVGLGWDGGEGVEAMADHVVAAAADRPAAPARRRHARVRVPVPENRRHALEEEMPDVEQRIQNLEERFRVEMIREARRGR